MELRENFSLQPLNTFGLDVRTRLFCEVASENELLTVLNDRRLSEERKMILGGGSNVLFTKSFDGLIIQNSIGGISVLSENDNEAVVRAGAGINWHSFVLFALENNFPGIENLSLIPGSVGATPIQNIGAYGVEIKSVMQSLKAISLTTGEQRIFRNKECNFGYRDSIFKNGERNKWAITEVTFRFNKNAPLNISYGAIPAELERMKISAPGIRDVSNAVIAIRQSKLPDPKVIGNAGSFFKNPEINAEQFEELKKKFAEIPGHPSSNGKIKLAAGWLIEQCGWKGLRNGEAGMHAKQALVLVNYGHATGQELIAHAEKVQQSVKEKFDVMLEMEVNIIR
jgi:UDP-N-acetylmuramate dehydrogenase